MTTSASAIAKRVFMSSLAGVLAGALIVLPLITALTTYPEIDGHARTKADILSAVSDQMLGGAGFAVIGLVVASPLIGIAVVVGVLFRRSIDRHPLLWASVAPMLAWLLTCAVFVLPDDGQTWLPYRSFPQRLLGTLRGIDNSLFFFAPAVAAIAVVLLTRRAARCAG